jgi:hypothetical protein
MDSAPRQTWIRAALLFGLAYFLIGRVFAQPTDHVRAWRLAAWIVSGVVYAANIWYERYRLRSSPRSTALHVAVGVAVGAFFLAVVGMINSVSSASGFRSVWILALVLWPAFLAIPAFVGAFLASTLLPRAK